MAGSEERESAATDQKIEQVDVQGFAHDKIAQVLQLNDQTGLDGDEFDPIAYINDKFPDENSLGPLEGGDLTNFLANCGAQLKTLKEGVSSAIRDDAIHRMQTGEAIAEAQTSIKELFDKIKSIKSKAEESERMVQAICQDIRKLDWAKTTLSKTINTVRKLHMLMSAVHQLRTFTDSRTYDRAADLVSVVKDFFAYFETFADIPQIQNLRSEVDKAREELKKCVFEDFRRFDPTRVDAFSERAAMDKLRNACKVVERLDPAVKDELTDWMANSQFEVYRAIFGPESDDGGLADTGRRFKWLERHLKKFEQGWEKIFPTHWNVSGILCKKFCDITAEHFRYVIANSNKNTPNFVENLVAALQKCVKFEAQMQKQWSLPVHNEIKDLYRQHGLLDEEDVDSADISDAERIKRNYRKEQVKKMEEQIKSSRGATDVEAIQFEGALTSAFTDHMHHYVALERSNLEEVISRVSGDTLWRIPSLDRIPEYSRHSGADDVLLYIRKSIIRCEKLKHGPTLFSVFGEYRYGLIQFSNVLGRFCKEPSDSSKSISTEHAMSDMISVIVIANTAEYVAETLEGLETKIKTTLGDGYSDKVNLADVKEENYEEICIKGLQNAIAFVMQAVETDLNRLPTQRNWDTLEELGDQSPFVKKLQEICERLVTIAHDLVSDNYRAFFDNNISKSILHAVIVAIFKIKRINTHGARQLQIDLQVIKKVLLNLPTLSSGEKLRVSNTFKKYINKEIAKLEALVKTVGTPKDNLIDIFQTLLPKGSFQDLSRICEMQGLSSKERQTIISRYNNVLSSADQNAPIIPESNSETRWWSSLTL